MGAGDEWANDAPAKPKHNPLRHDLAALAMWAGLAVIEWWDDRTRWERIYGVTRTVIVLAATITAVVVLGGCNDSQKPEPVEITGVDQGHVPFSPEQALIGKLNNSMAVTR